PKHKLSLDPSFCVCKQNGNSLTLEHFDTSIPISANVSYALLHLDPNSPEAQVFYQLGRSSNQSDGSPAPSPSEIFLNLWEISLATGGGSYCANFITSNNMQLI
ncbi:protein yls3, partial [Quercus suber]